jgi:hypothetical protein
VAARELGVPAVSHHVPGHDRRGVAGSGRVVPDLAVEVERDVGAVLGGREVMPAVADGGGREAGREGGPAEAEGERPTAVVGQDPAGAFYR